MLLEKPPGCPQQNQLSKQLQTFLILAPCCVHHLPFIALEGTNLPGTAMPHSCPESNLLQTFSLSIARDSPSGGGELNAVYYAAFYSSSTLQIVQEYLLTVSAFKLCHLLYLIQSHERPLGYELERSWDNLCRRKTFQGAATAAQPRYIEVF